MSKPENVVPISAGRPEPDPLDLTISIDNSHLRLRTGPKGGLTRIYPATVIDFPAADFWKPLAKPAQWSDECPDRGGSRAGRTKVKTFTIENGTNNITIHASAKEAEVVPDSERFGNKAALAKLAANWPAARLVEIWNSLPGAPAIQKFKDRQTGISRIWKAIQSLGAFGLEAAPVAPLKADVEPEKSSAENKGTRAKKTPIDATKKGTREGSKTEAILRLMKQPGGTTLKAIMEATSWQAHSVRGFISGTLGKKMGLKVLSTRGENGARSYSILA